MELISNFCPHCKQKVDFEVLPNNLLRCTVCNKLFKKAKPRGIPADKVQSPNADKVQSPNSPQAALAKPYIFISYKAENRAVADILIARFKAYGIGYWIAPECVPLGESYGGAIEKAIADCFGLVVLLSPEACASNQVCREIERCITHKKLLLPVVLQSGLSYSDELKYYFSNCQFKDISASVDGYSAELDAIALDILSRINGAVSATPGVDNDTVVNATGATVASFTPPVAAKPNNNASPVNTAPARVSAYGSSAVSRSAEVKTLVCLSCGGTHFAQVGGGRQCLFCGGIAASDANSCEFTSALCLADSLRQSADFEKASMQYSAIIRSYSNGSGISAAYWGLFLCENKVCFETNAAGEYFPAFYRVTKQAVVDNDNYQKALAAAEREDPQQALLLVALGEKIQAAALRYWDIAQNEQPYDIFICFKDDSDRGGEGKQLAGELYNEFSGKYRVFFSERSLRHIRGNYNEYEPYIYYALYSAKVMLLICGKGDDIDGERGKWVKNEWSRFITLAEREGGKKLLVPVFLKDFDPYDLPDRLARLQGFKDSRSLTADLAGLLSGRLCPARKGASVPSDSFVAGGSTSLYGTSFNTAKPVTSIPDTAIPDTGRPYSVCADSFAAGGSGFPPNTTFCSAKPASAMPYADAITEATAAAPRLKSITFGSYPQDCVTDNALISKLDAELAHCKKSDKRVIKDKKGKEAAVYYDISHGTCRYRALCKANGDTQWFSFNPVNWLVIGENDGSSSLLAADVLDCFAYSDGVKGRAKRVDYTGKKEVCEENNYAFSEIRFLLNTVFVDEAFGNQQRTKLLSVSVDNSGKGAYSDTNRYGCAYTRDIAWLPSYDEIKALVDKYPSLANKSCTRYAAAKCSVYSTDSCLGWRLRTPYEYIASQTYCVCSGAFAPQEAELPEIGIVPMVCLGH